MRKATFVCTVIFAALAIMIACDEMGKETEMSKDFSEADHGGGARFKVPLPSGYSWEVTQSWGEHCETCDDRYPSGESYCESSHTSSCCKYGWDFNLPGNADQGKPVLATSDGKVVLAREKNGWGNTVLIDHGDNICSRYAHLESIAVAEGDEVCQGLILGKIGNTGNSYGYHLHFQFEDCANGGSIPQEFDDGNDVPICTMGSDVFDGGEYSFLKLSNQQRSSCDGTGNDDDNELPEGGWLDADCGNLDGCPMNKNCDNQVGYEFPDQGSLSRLGQKAISYLYSECVISGKSDGKFHPDDEITRAEALKIGMYLFGLMEYCDDYEPFDDVDRDDWFFEVVVCAIDEDIISDENDNFRPNDPVSFAEAAKMIVLTAVEANVIELKYPRKGNFPHIPKDHWAYEYVETLYAYGALLDDPSEYFPDEKIDREDYAVMAAKLSPCFCPNINCEDSCTCKQEVFACVDPEDQDPGTGGEEDDDTLSDDDDDDDSGDDDCDCPPLSHCENDQCLIDEWSCDSSYQLHLRSPNGRYELYVEGVSWPIMVQENMEDTDYWFDISCLMIPAAILVEGGDNISVDINQFPNQPPFGVWLDWQGQADVNPATSPDIVSNNSTFQEEGQRILVRLPSY